MMNKKNKLYLEQKRKSQIAGLKAQYLFLSSILIVISARCESFVFDEIEKHK